MPMVAPDTPFEGPMVNEIGASTLYGGEMIPLLPPGAVYTSRDGSTWSMGTDGHVCHCVSVTLTVRPAAYVLGDGQHTRAYFGAWDGGDSQREFLAVADGFGRGLVTGGKAVVNSFVAVATLGYVPEAIAVTSEDRGNGYDTAALFGRIGWSAFFAAAGLGLADADVCLSNACFAAGTPLLTPDGAKPIEEFKVGDLVLSAPEENPDGRVTAPSGEDAPAPRPDRRIAGRRADDPHHAGAPVLRPGQGLGKGRRRNGRRPP